MGAVIGGMLLAIILEVVKEIKFSIEIAFGVLLLVFVLFQPNGIVVFVKRWLPGWRETLHFVPESEKPAEHRGGVATTAQQAESAREG